MVGLFAYDGMAQSLSQFTNAAEKAFMEKDYYSALSYYLEVTDFDTSDINVMYNVAESARNFSSYAIADDYYQKVVDRDSDGKYPMASYWLAEMLQMQGEYDEATTYYNIYLSEQEGEDEYLTAKAKKQISSAEWSKELLSNPAQNITISRLGDNINTEFSEFGAIYDQDNITYSSLAFASKERQNIPSKVISKLLKSSDGESVPYDDNINKDNLHTAHSSYNINKSKLYYTICEYKNASEIRCDLYSRAVLGDGTLGEEMKLPDFINSDVHTTTQPSVGFDRVSGDELLFFSSDRTGGEGKMDIWYSVINGVNSYSDPINITDINTPEDDITPFFSGGSQTLYFSSLGYTTLGGFDIYRTERNNQGFGQVENLGVPVNSSFNEMYYSETTDGDKILFSSNRTGTKFIDPLNESCCYDIFEGTVEDVSINLNAITFDGSSLDTLSDATVLLIDSETGRLIATLSNSDGGDHIFQLERGREYLIVSSKEGYANDTININTNRIYKSEDLIRKVFLKRSSLDLQVFAFDDVSKLPLPGTTIRLIDLTDNTVQEIVITNDNAHDFAFKIIPDHSYKIIASRDRYDETSAEFIARDENGSGIVTRNMYLGRRDLNIYLPLALYFDNDRPGQRSVSLTTDLDYSSTFDDYVIKKQEFKAEYIKTMSEEESYLGEQRIEDFFENDVKAGFDNFQSFLQAMLKQLNQGKTFELSIRGFASPRADSRYNLALSQRRVVSVERDIRNYLSGAFIPFIDNGQLKITQLSYGENLAPSNVSDVFYDRRNSVYSPEASKERRVEIVEIKSQFINE